MKFLKRQIFNCRIYTVFVLDVNPLRCLHWKIACLPCNTIWLIDCISFAKSQTICSQMSKREWHESNFPTVTSIES